MKLYCFLLLTLMSLGRALFAAAEQSASAPGETLQVIVLQGQNATNNIKLGQTIVPIVEVRDANGIPVQLADVTFQLPESGTTGIFANSSHSLTVHTTEAGQATPGAIQMSGQPGKLLLQVTARKGAEIGKVVVTQINATSGRARERKPKRKVDIRDYF